MDSNPEPWELSDEMKSFKFEFTPQLEKVRSWGPGANPYIGPFNDHDKPPYYKFRPEMILPKPSDTREFLRWCGLDDDAIERTIKDFWAKNPSLDSPSCGYMEGIAPSGSHIIEYPVLAGTVDEYIMSLGDLDYDYEESYEGYIKKAIQRGLQPAFAIRAGLHKDDPRVKADPSFAKRYFRNAPMYYAQGIVSSQSLRLQDLLTEKLIYEGKVRAEIQARKHLIMAHTSAVSDENEAGVIAEASGTKS